MGRRLGLTARVEALESQIRDSRDEMRDEFSYLSRRVESLERRMWLHAEGLRLLLERGDDNLLRTVIAHEQMIGKLTFFQERGGRGRR